MDREQWRSLVSASGTDKEQWKSLVSASATDREQWKSLVSASGTDREQWKYLVSASGTDREQWKSLVSASGTDREQWKSWSRPYVPLRREEDLASCTIACQTSVLVARPKMTKVTLKRPSHGKIKLANSS